MLNQSEVVFLRKTEPDRNSNTRLASKKHRLPGTLPPAIVCQQCHIRIADPEHRCSIHGMHLHTFTNSAGYVYHIACFTEVVNCKTDNAKTEEYSWFEGYAWQLLFCDVCDNHLGWRFSSSDEFYALITQRTLDLSGGNLH